MSFIQIVIAALLLLGPLVAIHEFGHFWVARRFGIKVLTFSIGFGPALLKWRGKDGVLYQFAAIPLGGFVRMADEREGEVPEADLPRAFNRQPPLVRMAVVAAGPLINLLFAVFLFWILYLPQSEQINTRIWQIEPHSPAAKAGLQVGDLITSVDGKSALDWEKLNYALIERMGETGTIALTVHHVGHDKTFQLPIQHFLRTSGADPLGQLGFYLYQPKIEAVLGEVQADGAGAKQGLQVGDRFVSIDGQPVTDWLTLTRFIHAHPEQTLSVVIERKGAQQILKLTPAAKHDDFGVKMGLLGIFPQVDKTQSYPVPAEYKQIIQHDPLTAFSLAVQKTWNISALTVTSFGKMLSGLIGLNNISGPITIAKVAGHTADMGWQAFIGFMAVMSVSLGILNLMPIPVLDGGQFVYFAIEAIFGRPVPERVQQFGFRIGLAMLGMLMIVAIFNDLTRLF
jgi:regulator of sigma E protease